MSKLRYSVVIPALNEAAAIGRCIEAVRAENAEAEIIVADGGSADRTPLVAAEHGAAVCHAPRSRGRQCNAGAKTATGDIIIFLHADTTLPPGAFEYLDGLFSDPEVKIGTFGLAFDRRHWLLGLISAYTSVHRGRQRFGDATITIRKEFFRELGGFPDQKLFEDYELLRRAGRQSRIHRFPLKVTTSTRRFEERGPLRQLVINSWFTTRYIMGTPPDKLAAEYEQRNRRLARRVLLMMCRYPRPGKVKKRLAADIGETAAADTYRYCAENLFAAADGLNGGVEKCLYVADAGDEEAVREWTGGRFSVRTQPEGDLGVRLTDGFARAFGDGAKKVIIAASDVPGIDTEILQEAFDSLEKNDVVVGPSPDGGYYLIGLTKERPLLFEDIPWSSDLVLANTLLRTLSPELKVHLTLIRRDIDDIEDYDWWFNSEEMVTEDGELKRVGKP